MPDQTATGTEHEVQTSTVQHHEPSYPSSDSLKNGPSHGKGNKDAKKRIEPGSSEDVLRSMPVDKDAERAVLSCMLKDPTNIVPEAVTELNGEFFYIPAHRIVFETILDLYQNRPNGKLDVILLNSELQDKELMDRVGGPKFVAELLDDVPTTAMFAPYVEVLKKKFILRRVISDCTKCAAEAYDHPEDAAVFLDGVEKKILKIRDETENEKEIKSMRTSVCSVVQTLEDIVSGGGSQGLMTGFKDIDKMTNGLHGGEMIVVAARPSMGKTSFVMNIVENISIREKDPVPSAIFSLEMSAEALVQRVLCSRSQVHMSKLRGGFLSKNDFPKLMKVAGEMAEAPIWIDDTPGLSINELRAKARRLKQQHDIGFIAIDYLQLLKAPDTASRDGREKEVAEISGGIKSIAKELHIPIIVLAQLNRQPDSRGGKPKMSDLRESGSIEQDADLVGLLMRPEYYAEDQEDREEKEGEAEFIIAKQRNGATGEVPLTFLKEFMRFSDRAYQDED